MKITKALLLSAAVVIVSACSDDDDKKSSLESAKLSFSADADLIEAPAGLTNSDNEYAMMASSWVDVANGMTQYISMMQAPSGATKSKTRITASNGRTKQTGDVLVYNWSDDQGNSVAYQISEEADKYVFEVFYKTTGTDWLKFFYVEEQKDRSAGEMKIYDIYGDNASTVVFSYEWTRANDILTITYSDTLGESSVVLSVNEKTGAGSVVYFDGAQKYYELIWDAEGNGSWTYYDEAGEVTESGTWEA